MTITSSLWLGIVSGAVGSAGAVVSWGRSADQPKPISSSTRWVFALTAGFAAGMAGWRLGLPSFMAVAPLLATIVVSEDRRRQRSRRYRQLDEQIPALVDVMIQRLRSGEGLHSICSRPPSIGTQVDAVMAPTVAAITQGQPLTVAIGHLAGDREAGQNNVELEGQRLLATALGIVASRGGPVAPALQRLRLTLTGLAQARAEARAQASQALASARLLILAPGLFAVMLATFDQDVADVYLRQPVGAFCMVGCVLLSYGSWRWMNRIIDNTDPSRRATGRA